MRIITIIHVFFKGSVEVAIIKHIIKHHESYISINFEMFVSRISIAQVLCSSLRELLFNGHLRIHHANGIRINLDHPPLSP